MELLTIRDVSKKYGLPDFMLRSMQKRGELPGFYSGNRFYVNCDLFLKEIENKSMSSMKNNANKNA